MWQGTGTMKTMKKVMILAYYFPPLGGSGVQRPLKLAKFLTEFGWTPIVVTVEGVSYGSMDQTLLNDAAKSGIRIERVRPSGINPQRIKPGGIVVPSPLRSRLLSFVTRWFFFPDNKTSWINASVDKAEKILSKEPIDLIFATAPPFSSFLAAKKLGSRHHIPVVMDYRDAWTNNQYHRPPTGFHRRKMANMEHRVLRHASAVTAVNQHTLDECLRHLSGNTSMKRIVIPNGYDPELMYAGPSEPKTGTAAKEPSHQNKPTKREKPFTLLHAGQLFSSSHHDRQKEIRLFLNAIDKMTRANPEMYRKCCLIFAGQREPAIDDWIQNREQGAAELQVIQTGYRPHHEVVNLMKQADALLLTLSDRTAFAGVTPGKMFEYFGTRKPIYALVPNGEAARYLHNYGAASVEHEFSTSAISSSLEQFIRAGMAGELPTASMDRIQPFNRKLQAKKLADFFDDLVHPHTSIQKKRAIEP